MNVCLGCDKYFLPLLYIRKMAAWLFHVEVSCGTNITYFTSDSMYTILWSSLGINLNIYAHGSGTYAWKAWLKMWAQVGARERLGYG